MTRLLLVVPLLVAVGCHRKPVPAVQTIRPAPGSIEVCILANDVDDAEGIAAARLYFASAATEPAVRKELEARAARGEPPPGPSAGEGLGFDVRGVVCQYRWVVVSPAFLRNRGIDPPAETGDGGDLFRQLAESRKTGHPTAGAYTVDVKPGLGAFWSRGGLDGLDYFVLARDEGDPIRGTNAVIEYDPLYRRNGRLAVFGELGESEAPKLLALTKRNGSTDIIKRLLAILFQDRLVYAAQVNEPLTRGQFVLDFPDGPDAAAQVESLLDSLRP